VSDLDADRWEIEAAVLAKIWCASAVDGGPVVHRAGLARLSWGTGVTVVQSADGEEPGVLVRMGLRGSDTGPPVSRPYPLPDGPLRPEPAGEIERRHFEAEVATAVWRAKPIERLVEDCTISHFILARVDRETYLRIVFEWAGERRQIDFPIWEAEHGRLPSEPETFACDFWLGVAEGTVASSRLD
jgi:hypothetical protein